MSVQSVISEYIKSNSKRNLCNIIQETRVKYRYLILAAAVLYIFLR
jgi:hypothetical protein